MNSPSRTIDLDLRGTVCPMAFVKLRLFADSLPSGGTFSVLYEDTPANEPLIRSVEGIGHRILSNEITNEAGARFRFIRVEIAG